MRKGKRQGEREGEREGGREGEKEGEREEGKEGELHSHLLQCGVWLFSRSSVSRRVGKCWLEVKGRRKVSSALTSEAS